MSAKLYHQASAGETEPKNFRQKLYVIESEAVRRRAVGRIAG